MKTIREQGIVRRAVGIHHHVIVIGVEITVFLGNLNEFMVEGLDFGEIEVRVWSPDTPKFNVGE
jgi:hypothetical protein